MDSHTNRGRAHSQLPSTSLQGDSTAVYKAPKYMKNKFMNKKDSIMNRTTITSKQMEIKGNDTYECPINQMNALDMSSPKRTNTADVRDREDILTWGKLDPDIVDKYIYKGTMDCINSRTRMITARIYIYNKLYDSVLPKQGIYTHDKEKNNHQYKVNGINTIK